MIAARNDSERLTDYSVHILAHGLREMRSFAEGKESRAAMVLCHGVQTEPAPWQQKRQ